MELSVVPLSATRLDVKSLLCCQLLHSSLNWIELNLGVWSILDANHEKVQWWLQSLEQWWNLIAHLCFGRWYRPWLALRSWCPIHHMRQAKRARAIPTADPVGAKPIMNPITCRVVWHIVTLYHQMLFYSAVTRCFLGGAKGVFVKEKVLPACDTPGDGLVERVCSEDNTLRLRVLHVCSVQGALRRLLVSISHGAERI